MKLCRVFLIFLVWGLIGSRGVAYAQSYTFLIQDKWGVIVGVTLSSDGTATEPEVVRGMLDSPEYSTFVDLEANRTGGYQLLSNGFVVPVGKVKIPFSFWAPVADAKRIVLAPDGEGAWVATGNSIRSRGRPPQLVIPAFDARAVIADLEYDTAQDTLGVLLQNGKIALCTSSKFEWIESLSLKKEKALDLEFVESGFYVLTDRSKVYSVTRRKSTPLSDIPELGLGLSCNLELSPFGPGFYVLDVFGVIHACQGAPRVPTLPLPQDAAVDLEIVPLDAPPNWYPSGWNTKASLHPDEVVLDPSGKEKTVTLSIQNAENVSGFLAEVRYNPALLSVDPLSVRLGKWWEESIQGAQVWATPDAGSGSLFLYGGGSFSPFTGVSGGGELTQFAVKPSSSVQFATTSIDLVNFSFRDAYPGNVYRSAQVIQSVSVTIQPLTPLSSLSWYPPMEGGKRVIKPGELVRADLRIENGSRIKDVTFDFHFTPNSMRFLGMTLGDCWAVEAPVRPVFGTPSEGNQNGLLLDQQIHAGPAGSCRDEPGSLVTFFFVATVPGEGFLELNRMTVLDEEGKTLNVGMGNQKLLFLCR